MSPRNTRRVALAASAPGTQEGEASADTAAQPTKEQWSYKTGRRPHSVVIVERLDRGGALQLRYTDATGRHMPFLRAPHPQGVRGIDRKGRPRIDAKAEALAKALATAVSAALTDGRDPTALIDPPLDVRAETAAVGSLTLRALVEAAAPAAEPLVDEESTVASLRGVYGADTPDAREFRQLALRGVAVLERVLRGRGVPAVCAELEQSDWVEAGRLFLDEFRSSRQNSTGGLRTAQRALGAVVRCGSWACSAASVPLTSFNAPKSGWRRDILAHLERTQKAPIRRHVDLQDRLTEVEAGRLLALVFDLSADVDPRFRLAMVLGYPLRLGQVARRVWRSCVTLAPIGAFGAGRVRVAASGNKPSAGFDLHPDERAVLDAMLAGPLSKLEAAFRQGTLPDYPMMPAGRMRKGAVPVTPGQELTSVSSRRLLECYAQAEEWVDIHHVPGRSWYALRRTCTDAGSAVTKDADVRAQLGGWALHGTRGRVYRDAGDLRLLADVGQARAALRALLMAATPTPATHRVRPKPELARRDSPAACARHAAAAEVRAARQSSRPRQPGAKGVRKSSVVAPMNRQRRGGDHA